MRWPWSKVSSPAKHRSPLDADVIRPGDPMWAVWEQMKLTGRPVVGIYDSSTGFIVAMRTVEPDSDSESQPPNGR